MTPAPVSAHPPAPTCYLSTPTLLQVLNETLCPTWDQMLVFDNLELYGEAHRAAGRSPYHCYRNLRIDTMVTGGLWHLTGRPPLPSLTSQSPWPGCLPGSRGSGLTSPSKRPQVPLLPSHCSLTPPDAVGLWGSRVRQARVSPPASQTDQAQAQPC